MGGDCDAQHRLRDRGDQLLGCRNRGGVLAEEHRAIDGEVEIVDDVDQVDARIVRIGEKLAVGRQRLLIVDEDVVIVPAQHIEVRRHVDEMTRVRHDLPQPIAGAQRPLRERRHLHQVDIEMKEAGVVPCGGNILQGVLQDHPAFLGPRPFGGLGPSAGPTSATASRS